MRLHVAEAHGPTMDDFETRLLMNSSTSVSIWRQAVAEYVPLQRIFSPISLSSRHIFVLVESFISYSHFEIVFYLANV